MSSGIKAGLIGAAAGVVLGLIGLIPVVGCCTGILGLLVYVAVGALAAFWMTPPRNAGAGAGQGAIAGVISGIGGGVVSSAMALIYALTGSTNQVLLDPQVMQQLEEAGIELDPQMLSFFTGTAGGVLGCGLCCVGSLAIGAALGAIGGAVFAAVKQND